MFGVSRTVVRQALSEMESSGLIVRRKGKGSYVAEPKIIESLAQELTGFHQDMREQGHRPVSHVLFQGVIAAPSVVARYLQIPADTSVVHLRRLRFVQGEPIVLVSSYLPSMLCPGLENVDFRQQSLYAYLERSSAWSSLVADEALRPSWQTLKRPIFCIYEVGDPLILLDSVSYREDNIPVEYYRALHRGDRSQI